MRWEKSSQRPFAWIVEKLLVGAMVCASLTFCKANVEAAETLSTSGSSLSHKVDQISAQEADSRPTDFVSRVEALTFADLVYREDFGKQALPDGWSLVRSGDGGLKDSPLRWALFERDLDGQRVLSFAGTRPGNVGDWLDNFYSSSSFAPVQDLIRGSPQIYKALGLSPYFQDDQAYQKTLDELHANKYSGRGRPLVLVGDSKAGREVQVVSSLTKTFGITRNSAPVGQDLLSRIPQENKNWANAGGVLGLELVPDPVSKLDFLPGSAHLGLQESYEVPKAWRDEYMKKVITPNLVESGLGMARYAYFSHTERDLLLRAVMDKERPASQKFTDATRIESAPPSFASQSSLNSGLYWQNRRMIADGIADNLDLFHGKAGEVGQAAKLGFQGLSFLYDTHESLGYIKLHPGDPASDWEKTSIAVGFYSLFGPRELLRGVAGRALTLGSLAKTFGEATRSHILENRTGRMVNFGGAVPQGAANIQDQEQESHYGYFSLMSDRYSVQGGWELRDSNERLFERDSQSTLWANTQVRDLHTANGSEISGMFRRSELREERGGSIFNLYEPTLIKISRRSYDSYRVTFDGAHWNDGVESKTVTFPTAPIPNISPPKDPPLSYRDETKKYLPPRTEPIFAPRQPPPPSAVSNPIDLGGISFKPRREVITIKGSLRPTDEGGEGNQQTEK